MGIAEIGKLVGGHLALFEQGSHQPVGNATVLCTFTHGVNGRVKGLHDVVDDDAAFTVESCAFGQLGIGYDTDTHDHEVGPDFTAVLEAHALYTAITDDFLGGRFHQEGHAAFFQRGL